MSLLKYLCLAKVVVDCVAMGEAGHACMLLCLCVSVCVQGPLNAEAFEVGVSFSRTLRNLPKNDNGHHCDDDNDAGQRHHCPWPFAFPSFFHRMVHRAYMLKMLEHERVCERERERERECESV